MGRNENVHKLSCPRTSRFASFANFAATDTIPDSGFDCTTTVLFVIAESFVEDPTKEHQPIFNDVSYFVMFVGYPRSGHTLIGSLLDAHPHAIIANEFDVIGEWQLWSEKNKTRNYLFSQLYKTSQEDALTGYRSMNPHRYSYHVPKQWQGRFKAPLKVSMPIANVACEHIRTRYKV